MKRFFITYKKKLMYTGIFVLLAIGIYALAGSPRIGFQSFKDPLDELNKIKEMPVQTSASVVTKVIDGDTVIVQGGDSVRLLGIDSDEKTYPCFEQAKKEMETLVLGKEVTLERDQEDKDIYKRLLRYIFVGEQNVNLEMVKRGMAVARFYPENQKYKNEITKAEAEAIKAHTGCKWRTQ